MLEMIYLACPYSDPDQVVRVKRFRQANCYAAALLAQGLLVFSPLSHSVPIAEAGELSWDWEGWEGLDRLFLSICDVLVVLRLPGWQKSIGVRNEIKYFEREGKPIVFGEPWNLSDASITISTISVIRLIRASQSGGATG